MNLKNKWQQVHIVQINYGYGHGWEDTGAHLSRRDACREREEYRENMPEYAVRVIARRVLTEKYLLGEF